MILGFKKEINGKPTNFREKILAGVPYKHIVGSNDYFRIDKIIELVQGNHFFEGMVLHARYNPETKVLTDVNGDFWPFCLCYATKINPKLHTIRLDPPNRWKAGMNIQMVYRGKNYSIEDHFNKGIPELERCVSVQKIKMWWTGSLSPHENPSDRYPVYHLNCLVDGKRIDIEQLSVNDGFESVDDFRKWFNKDFEGRLIHWTDLRY